MKQLAVLFLSVGLIAGAASASRSEEDKKKDDKKEDKKVDKKDDKKEKVDDKKEVKKPEPPSPEQLKELQALSGTFNVTTFEENGKKFPEEDLKKMKVVQKGAKWSFHYGEEVTEGEDSVHPGKTPKEIDSTYTSGLNKGKTVKGLYAIDGDTIKYCWAAPGKDRPKAFESKADSGITVMILKKTTEVKPKDKEEKKGDKEKKLRAAQKALEAARDAEAKAQKAFDAAKAAAAKAKTDDDKEKAKVAVAEAEKALAAAKTAVAQAAAVLDKLKD
jgi:uncharacterized protein (TIGR03067 family)